MSNYSSCIFILTQLFGFEKCDNHTKLQLPHEVENDVLIEFRNFLQDSSTESKLNDELSSYEKKLLENDAINSSFWACGHCTYHNSMNFNTCQMCNSPPNDEQKTIRDRLEVREIIAQNNMTDQVLYDIICDCAFGGWVKELRLALNVSRSPVECCLVFEWKIYILSNQC